MWEEIREVVKEGGDGRVKEKKRRGRRKGFSLLRDLFLHAVFFLHS